MPGGQSQSSPGEMSTGTKTLLGCLGGGCLVLIIGIIVAVVMVGSFTSKLKGLAEDQPSVQAYQPSEAESELLEAKWRKFSATLEAGKTAELELSANDINTAISTLDQFKQFKGKFFVRIEGDLLSAQASIPVLQKGGPTKYLNCEITGNAKIADGNLELYAKEIRVKGEPLSGRLAWLLQNMTKGNLTPNFSWQPKNQELIQDIESMEVKDGKIILRFKTGKPGRKKGPAR